MLTFCARFTDPYNSRNPAPGEQTKTIDVGRDCKKAKRGRQTDDPKRAKENLEPGVREGKNQRIVCHRARRDLGVADLLLFSHGNFFLAVVEILLLGASRVSLVELGFQGVARGRKRGGATKGLLLGATKIRRLERKWEKREKRSDDDNARRCLGRDRFRVGKSKVGC